MDNFKKKLLILFSIIVACFSLWCFFEFIKTWQVMNYHMLSICQADSKIRVETREFAKYIESLETVVSEDTLQIIVMETTILNPFSSKKFHSVKEIPQQVKYYKIGNKPVPPDYIRHCNN